MMVLLLLLPLLLLLLLLLLLVWPRPLLRRLLRVRRLLPQARI
jgi:hypothetical protein